MCYSGRCPYENYLGDCSIKSEVADKWKEKGYTACKSEWDMVGELEDYYEVKKEIEQELKI